MAVEITPPPRGVYDWRVPFVLDGVGGSLHWRWSPVAAMWYIHLLGADGALIAGPIPLATEVDLLEQWQAYDVPTGALIVDFDGDVPGISDFGDRARLIYVLTGET